MSDLEAVFAELVSGEICPLEYASDVWQRQKSNNEELYAERHPLGFIKIELSKLIDDRSLSLHLWHNTQRTPLHSHHFDMESYVFRGMLLDVEFEYFSDPKAALKCTDIEYDAEEAERHFLLRDGYYRAERHRTRLIKNCSYQIAKARMHSTRALVPRSASVLLRRNVGRTGSACLTTTEQLKATQSEEVLDQSEVLQILNVESEAYV
jgi:hypothetical protein